MYVENIVTPHPYKGPTAPRPLLEVIDPASSIERLNAQSDDPEAYARELTEITDQLSLKVNQALWFSNAKDAAADQAATLFDEQHLREAQVTDCYGYTTVLSECLAACGIHHYVGYANGHSMTVVPFTDKKGSRLYFADALIPRLNQVIDPANRRRDKAPIESKIATYGRAAITLDTASLAMQTGKQVEELSRTYPWLEVSKSATQTRVSGLSMQGNELEELRRYRSRHVLILSLFPYVRGRQMLADHAALVKATEKGELPTACAHLARMEGLFPELDARQSHRELHTLVESLCAQGQAEQATAMVDSYFTSFRLSDDSRFLQARGDLLRRIARLSGLPYIARLAIDSYTKAAEKPYAFHDALRGKVAATNKLMVQLES